MSKVWQRWLLACLMVSLALFLRTGTARAISQVTVWLQVMDSCKEALPGAHFTLVDPHGNTFNAGPSAGTKRVKVSSGTCTLQRGNCKTIPTGCLYWSITPPSSGFDTYTIKESPTWNAKDGFFENPPGPTAFSGFVPCNGGSACRSQQASFTVNASGVVRGMTTNILPDGKISTYPPSGTSAGNQTDPIVFHNFQLGNGSCDGDSDADDHLTGSPSSHCDSDTDHRSHTTTSATGNESHP